MKKENKFVITLISILLGIITGGILLAIFGYNPIEAYKIIITGVISNPKYISYTIVRSTPIIITGISVAFAYQTGLFNIGAEGQYIMGTIFTALAGKYITFLPPVIHAIVAILIGALAGAIWGGIVGLLKAKRGLNEVIVSIMMNWIAFYLNNYILSIGFKKANAESSYPVLDSARINILGKWKVSESGRAFLANNQFLKDLLNPPVNFGIFIAIFLAVAVWYILKNTTLGYELKAVGFNREAAEYGGINIEKNIIRSMAIAGAISAIAGATQVLGVTGHISVLAQPDNFGFDGMAVALVAGNNPIGAIASGLLFGALKYGGGKLNSSSLKAPSEVVNIIIGIIVFFVAMPRIYDVFKDKFAKKESKTLERGGENAK